jgi:SAM-dependent methyltransferase
MPVQTTALIDAASRPYRAAGRFAFHFARAKLRHDPVFLAVLRSGRIPDRARLLDLGCGQGLLEALLLAARERFDAGHWICPWPAPPAQLQLHGIEAQPRAAQRARKALGQRVTIESADLCAAALPQADVVVLIDVLHYLHTDDQVSLLLRIEQALRGGGLLVTRVADASAGWRFRLSRASDHVGALLTGRGLPQHHHRSIGQWLDLLASLGFDARLDIGSARQSFANVLIWAKAPGTGKA